MWTCSKCGEKIEDQFDSCWKCAAETNQIPASIQQPKLRWFHYVIAVIVAYSLPWLAIMLSPFLSERGVNDVVSNYRGDESNHPIIWIGMLVPAAITFLILLPFLRFPMRRRLAFVGVCLGWILLIGGARTK
jgi:hypothetical protein